MKKYFNEKGEQFKLEKGTISEIKNYQGRTTIYLTQDEETKKWRMTFAGGWIENDGSQTWNKRIPLGICSKEELADWLGYCFDEDDDIPALLKQTHDDLQARIKELELEAIKEIEEEDE